MEKENNKEQRPTYSKFPSLAQSQPWLVFVHGKNRQRQTFFNILEGRYYVKIIPEMRNKRICSSCHGWLVLKDLNSQDCFFLNPMTLEKIQLPSLHGFKMQSCNLSSPPTNTKSYLFFICEGNRVTPQIPRVLLTTRQPMKYLCLLSRDSYMSKNGHLGPYINTHQKSNQLYYNSSRVNYITLNTNIY